MVVVAVWFALGAKNMKSGIRTENMDLAATPGDDFYDYATGGWRKLHPIPDDYSRYGVFDELRDENLNRVRKIAESDNGKIGALYAIAMNEKKLNSDGIKPAEKLFDEIDAIESKSDLPKYLGAMQKYSGAFWGDGIALDEMDSEYYIYNIGQGGVGLARDYYFDDDAKSVEIRAKYKKYIADITARFGIAADAEKIYLLEERMAKSFYTKEKLRDPHANYHKISYDEFKKEFSGFNWDEYFDARGAHPEFVNVNQPEAVTTSIKIISNTDLDLVKSYLKFQIANGITDLVDDTTYEISFDFYNRTMAGQPVPKPRWKRSVGKLNASLGEMIGKLYVDEYFHADAKEYMEKLVENLRRAYALRIENLDWMSDTTKEKALEKLSAFKAKIGYPNKWRDYSKLEINAADSLLDNMLHVSLYEDKFWMDKIGTRIEPDTWLMNAHDVNAYYYGSANEICFPAGILQYPFFDMTADDAFNYGAIGAVIGHEMTHGFDDQGRKFDKDGNMKDWWTSADAAAFDERASVMREYFDNIQVAPGVYANGEFTLGETLADYGGVTISFTAYKNFGAPGDDRDFFRAYAMTEAGNIRDAEILRLTKVDEHPLSRWRVNGILPHIDAWYDAFEITQSDKLFIGGKKRVRVW